MRGFLRVCGALQPGQQRKPVAVGVMLCTLCSALCLQLPILQ